jgi:hypothetical protein
MLSEPKVEVSTEFCYLEYHMMEAWLQKIMITVWEHHGVRPTRAYLLTKYSFFEHWTTC